MNNPLELTPEEARFLDHVIHEGCSHSPPIAHKMLVDLGVYSSGWTVAALETIRIWELGQLVTERPNTPIALPLENQGRSHCQGEGSASSYG